MGEVELLAEWLFLKGLWIGSSARETWTELWRAVMVPWASKAGVEHSAQHTCQAGRTNCSEGSCRLVDTGSLTSLGEEGWTSPLLCCISRYGSGMMGKGLDMTGREGVSSV